MEKQSSSLVQDHHYQKSLTHIKKCKNVTKIVADGAVRALLEKNIKPDILVTDLDGDLDSIKKIGQNKDSNYSSCAWR